MYFFINDLNYSTYFLFLVCEMSQLCVHFFTVSCGVLNKDVINLKQLYRQYLCCVREGGRATHLYMIPHWRKTGRCHGTHPGTHSDTSRAS